MKPFTFPVVLPADAAIDLQLHTIYSDGTWTPAQLIDYLRSEQFGLAAITDHDRPDTAAELQQLAAEKQFPLLTAVEISASWRGEPNDVLCYGFDPHQNALQELAQDIVHRQRENTREVCENLCKAGISFPDPRELDAILAQPSAQQPHSLVALLKKLGYGTGEPSAGKLIRMLVSSGSRRTWLKSVMPLTRVVRSVSSPILAEATAIPASMHTCLTSFDRELSLMVSRFIILPTPQSR